MSKLFDPRAIVKLTLPSFPESEVEMYDGLLTGEMKKLTAIGDETDQSVQVLITLMKSWNFTDDDDKPLPITSANILKLPTKDFTFLSKKVADSINSDEEKKEQS